MVPDPDATNGCALYLTVVQDAAGAFTSARIRGLPDGALGSIMPEALPDGSSRAVRVAFRGKLPPGAASGIWPAFWMLPSESDPPVRSPAHSY